MAIFDINTPVQPDPGAAEEIGTLAPETENQQPETTGSTEGFTSLPTGDPLGHGSGFPLKMALAIAVIAAVLAGAHLIGKPNLGLDFSAFLEVIHLRWPAPPAAPVPTAPVVAHQAKPGEKLPPVSAVFADDSNSLDPFFAALWQVGAGQIRPSARGVQLRRHSSPLRRLAHHSRPDHRRYPRTVAAAFWRRRTRLHTRRQALGLVRPSRCRDHRPRLEDAHRRRTDAPGNLRPRRRGL